jgi:hypothetical protein
MGRPAGSTNKPKVDAPPVTAPENVQTDEAIQELTVDTIKDDYPDFYEQLRREIQAEIVSEPNESESEASEPVVSVSDNQTVLRRLRGFATRLGLKFAPYIPQETIEAAVSQADELTEPNTYWHFNDPNDLDMVVRAVDPEGNWEAALSLDGEFSVCKFAQPNLYNRRAGMRIVGDQRLDVFDIDDLIARLVAMRDGADPVLNEFGAYLADKKAKEDKALKAQSSDEPTPEEQDWTLIDKYAAEYGLMVVGREMRVYRLCEALNLPICQRGPDTGLTKIAKPHEELRADLIAHLETL